MSVSTVTLQNNVHNGKNCKKYKARKADFKKEDEETNGSQWEKADQNWGNHNTEFGRNMKSTYDQVNNMAFFYTLSFIWKNSFHGHETPDRPLSILYARHRLLSGATGKHPTHSTRLLCCFSYKIYKHMLFSLIWLLWKLFANFLNEHAACRKSFPHLAGWKGITRITIALQHFSSTTSPTSQNGDIQTSLADIVKTGTLCMFIEDSRHKDLRVPWSVTDPRESCWKTSSGKLAVHTVNLKLLLLVLP